MLVLRELIPCPNQQARQQSHLVTAASPFVDKRFQWLSFDSCVCAIAVCVSQVREYAVQRVHGYLRYKSNLDQVAGEFRQGCSWYGSGAEGFGQQVTDVGGLAAV